MNEQKKMDAERVAFEEYARIKGYPLEGHGGYYSNIRTRNLWLGWQARASLPVGVPDAVMSPAGVEEIEIAACAWISSVNGKDWDAGVQLGSEKPNLHPRVDGEVFDYSALIAREKAVAQHQRIVSALSGGVGVTAAARDVLSERHRQVNVKGWAPEHDDRNESCEMAAAAATYATCTEPEQLQICGAVAWPWRREWWKPTTYRHNLVKAGALILAEIERLDRLQELDHGPA